MVVEGEGFGQLQNPTISLRSVTIIQELNLHDRCELRLQDAHRIDVAPLIGKKFRAGAVEQSGSTLTLFEGFVLEATSRYDSQSNFKASILGISFSYLLEAASRQRYYLNKTVQNLIGLLTAQANLAVTMLGATLPAAEKDYLQYGESDFAFLKRLLDECGCWFRAGSRQTWAPVSSTLVTFGEASDIQPKIEICGEIQEPGATSDWGGVAGDLVNFEVKGRVQPFHFVGAHYDPAVMESKSYPPTSEEPAKLASNGAAAFVASTLAAELPPVWLSDRSGAAVLDDYENQLKRESRRARANSVVGKGTTQNPAVLAGDTLTIQSGASEFDLGGKYGVARVVHRFGLGHGYANDFECIPWKHFSAARPPAPPMWAGPVPARVAANDDPNKLGRVKVQFFWQEDGPTDWLRIITPHAGHGRGFYFLPEVGDEVLVIFEDGDPGRPVVLGALWNGVDRPPAERFWPEQVPGHSFKDNTDNRVKRIVTRSGHRIQIVDSAGSDQTAKEAISLATPTGLKISLIDRAEETSRPMITLHSETGDIFISAPAGRVHIHSKWFSREVGEHDPPTP